MPSAGSVDLKLHKTAWVIAWVTVLLGGLAAGMGVAGAQHEARLRGCISNQLGNSVVDALFNPPRRLSKADRAKLEEWARTANVDLRWESTSDEGRQRVHLVGVKDCDGSIDRWSYEHPADIFNGISVGGIAIGMAGVGAVVVLAWLRWLLRRPAPQGGTG